MSDASWPYHPIRESWNEVLLVLSRNWASAWILRFSWFFEIRALLILRKSILMKKVCIFVLSQFSLVSGESVWCLICSDIGSLRNLWACISINSVSNFYLIFPWHLCHGTETSLNLGWQVNRYIEILMVWMTRSGKTVIFQAIG